MDYLEPWELQEIVFLTGSKKDFALYLGYDQKKMTEVWQTNSLKTPTEWARSLSEDERFALLAKHGSAKKMAERYGMSEAFLKTLLSERPLPKELTEDEITSLLERYKSVRLMARCTGMTESYIRKEADRLDLEIAPFLDYSVGNNSNAKGRRAELEYAVLRGDFIEGDLNLLEGSQAEADFVDREYGRVNVKSSRKYRYKAQTRKENPEFWKISLKGRSTADHIVAMCYCERMQTLEGVIVLQTKGLPNVGTLTILRNQLNPAKSLTPCGAEAGN